MTWYSEYVDVNICERAGCIGGASENLKLQQAIVDNAYQRPLQRETWLSG